MQANIERLNKEGLCWRAYKWNENNSNNNNNINNNDIWNRCFVLSYLQPKCYMKIAEENENVSFCRSNERKWIYGENRIYFMFVYLMNIACMCKNPLSLGLFVVLIFIFSLVDVKYTHTHIHAQPMTSTSKFSSQFSFKRTEIKSTLIKWCQQWHSI